MRCATQATGVLPIRRTPPKYATSVRSELQEGLLRGRADLLCRFLKSVDAAVESGIPEFAYGFVESLTGYCAPNAFDGALCGRYAVHLMVNLYPLVCARALGNSAGI